MMRRGILQEKICFWGLRLATYAILAVVLWILLDIFFKGISSISWDFLTGTPREGGLKGGILPVIVGTSYLILCTLVVALPLGIGCAIYLSEYARQGRLVRFIRLAIVTLAGIPSIVFGLFGMGLFVFFLDFQPSILSASLTLACMVLPTVIVASEEAIRAVPKGLREGALALGATPWQTIFRNVLPYAMPGILTGNILALGRAAGETAPILLTGAVFSITTIPTTPADKFMALPYHLFILSTQSNQMQLALPMAYGTALTLLLLVLGLTTLAALLRAYFRRKYQW